MFILDRPSSSEPTYIFIKTTLSDGELKYSTRQKIKPTQWIKAALRAQVKNLDKDTASENRSINAILERLEAAVRKYAQDLRFGSTERKDLIDAMDLITGRKSPFKKKTFYEACTEIIEDMQSGKITVRKGSRRGKKYSKGTIKNYRQSLDVLKQFGNKRVLKFETVSMDTYYQFIEFCNKQDFSLNYTGQHLKNFKCLLEEACRRGLHQNRIFENKEFRTLSEETDDIAFTEKELYQLMRVEKLNATQIVARDWFILDCYLGLRVCDMKILSDQNIQKDRIMIMNEKTDEKVVLPIHPIVKEILKKYSGLPPSIAEQTINEKIKEVAKKAKLNQAFIYSLTKGGERRDHYLEKWEMASNHSARRSYITNLLLAGVDFAKVMKLAGIKKPQTLMRYMKVTPEQNADDTAKHPFFSKKMKVV